jgi:hypothetical protein
MSKRWTVYAHGTVHADFDQVARWWTDDQRAADWRSALERVMGTSITWHESTDAGDHALDARWVTRKGTRSRYLVVTHPAQHSPTPNRQLVQAKTVLSEQNFTSRRPATRLTGEIETRLEAQASRTKVQYQHSYFRTGGRWWDRLPLRFRMARTARRDLRRRIRQCETNLGLATPPRF